MLGNHSEGTRIHRQIRPHSKWDSGCKPSNSIHSIRRLIEASLKNDEILIEFLTFPKEFDKLFICLGSLSDFKIVSHYYIKSYYYYKIN